MWAEQVMWRGEGRDRASYEPWIVTTIIVSHLALPTVSHVSPWAGAGGVVSFALREAARPASIFLVPWVPDSLAVIAILLRRPRIGEGPVEEEGLS